MMGKPMRSHLVGRAFRLVCLPMLSAFFLFYPLVTICQETKDSNWPEEAQERYTTGKQLFVREKYDTAVGAFLTAYDALEGHPDRYVVFYHIGKCHEKLLRFESALEAYREYLKDGGMEAAHREEVEKTVLWLETQAAKLKVQYAGARRHILQGEAFYTKENYDAAIAEFEQAYEQLAGHPLRAFVLFNVARCHERQFRYDQAIRYYRRYLEEAGADAEDRQTVETTLAGLLNLLGMLQITSNVRAEVWIEDRLMGVSPGTVYVPGGHHMIEFRAVGYESKRESVRITAGELEKYEVELDEISSFQGLPKGYFWTGAALSLGSLGTAIILGSQAMAKDAEGRDQSPKLDKGELSEEISRLALSADIMYGVAGLFAVTTLVISFITNWDIERKDPMESRATALPIVTEDSFGLMVNGVF